MLGKPKYNYEDVVQFETNGGVKVGRVEIIDEYGTFFNTKDVSYDILVKNDFENCLYKHITESRLTKIESLNNY